MADYILYGNSPDHTVTSASTVSWASARTGAGTLTDSTGTIGLSAGYIWNGTTWTVAQAFLSFDTSGIIDGTVSNATLYLNQTNAPPTAIETLEVIERAFATGTAAFVAAGSLGTAVGSYSNGGGAGLRTIALALTSIAKSATYGLMVSPNRQRNATTPPTTGFFTSEFSASETTGTTNDPRLEFTVTPLSASATFAYLEQNEAIAATAAALAQGATSAQEQSETAAGSGNVPAGGLGALFDRELLAAIGAAPAGSVCSILQQTELLNAVATVYIAGGASLLELTETLATQISNETIHTGRVVYTEQEETLAVSTSAVYNFNSGFTDENEKLTTLGAVLATAQAAIGDGLEVLIASAQLQEGAKPVSYLAGQRLRLGANSEALVGNFWQGEIKAVVVLNSTATPADIALLEDALRSL